MVPAQDVYSIRLGLASQGIPTVSDGGVGFELFDKPTFGESDFMQRANYYRALQGELARTIRELDEVSNARVLIVVPESKLFGQEHEEAKASVFIQLQTGRSLNDDQVRAIRFLVANGVEGLQPEHVAVVDSTGRALAGSDSTSSGDSQVTDKQRQARADLEHYLEDKAQTMLDQVLGPGEAVVRVASEIDYSQVQQTTETYSPKTSAPKTETSTVETSSTRSDSTASAAGVSSNTSTAGGGGKSDETKKQDTTTDYEVGKVTESRVIGSGAIKRLTVALMLNERKPPAGSPPGTKATPRTPQEIQQLENIVKAAVGFEQTDTRQDVIQSQEVPFADIFADTAPAPQKTLAQQVNNYLPYVTQGCLVLLAIGILLYFRSLTSSSGVKGEGEPDSFESLLNNYQVQANGNGHGPIVRANGNGSASNSTILTPTELSRLIRENPDNASQALRAWLRRN
jgi:flagellar M-ring protein FliF